MSLESSASAWDGISFWLVAFGAVLAFLGAVAGIHARRLNRRLTIEKAVMARREKDLNDKAIAEAGARAEEAKRDAAIANEKAEHERLERLKIEAKLAPRVLSNEQYRRLIDDLKALGKQKIELFALIQHDEVVSLRDELIAIFRKAGWDARANLKHRVPSFGAVLGIAIEMPFGASHEVRTTALALEVALRRAGLQTSEPIPSYNIVSDAPMELLIGNKP